MDPFSVAPSHTLADALLDDLEGLSDADESAEADNDVEEVSDDQVSGAGEAANDGPDAGDRGGKTTAVASGTGHNDDAKGSAASLLSADRALQRHLEAIRRHDTDRSSSENGDEYRLVVESNRQLRRVHEALHAAHLHLCQSYHVRFPELADLLPDPVQYSHAVRVLGDGRDDADVTQTTISEALGRHAGLGPHQVLAVSVSASTTAGRPLNDGEWGAVLRALDRLQETLDVRDELTRFVERHLRRMAPNVCALVGPEIAARLLGLAGGLEELSRIPACNLQVLGQTRHTAASRVGLSTSVAAPSVSTVRHHQGVLADCDLVRSVPNKLQIKVLKAVAAKVALAARCDFARVATIAASASGRSNNSRNDKSTWEIDAASGLAFRREVERAVERWQLPDQAPVLKALPKPDLTIKKRRGGKRVRRLKEKYDETALMKQANTRAFSAAAGEYGDDAMGLTRGLLDTVDGAAAAIGSVRQSAREVRKMRQANTKASRKRAATWAAQAAAQGGGGGLGDSTATGGLATSLAFTPVQGMELVNPEVRANRLAQANKKWFNEHSGFRSAVPKK